MLPRNRRLAGRTVLLLARRPFQSRASRVASKSPGFAEGRQIFFVWFWRPCAQSWRPSCAKLATLLLILADLITFFGDLRARGWRPSGLHPNYMGAAGSLTGPLVHGVAVTEDIDHQVIDRRELIGQQHAGVGGQEGG